MNPKRFHIRRGLPLLCAAVLLALAVGPAHASWIISIDQPLTANAGSTGNAFDVVLTNTGPGDTIIGTSFGISTNTSNINFTSATTSTAGTYIFAGDSLFGPTINSTSGQSLLASDLSASGNGTFVGTGDTVDLGHVFFDVASGTPAGPITVTFDASQTSLTDSNLNSLPTTLDDGTITINSQTPATVPEPSSLTLCTVGLLTLAGAAWRRRKRLA